jgi:hypothetical protein
MRRQLPRPAVIQHQEDGLARAFVSELKAVGTLAHGQRLASPQPGPVDGRVRHQDDERALGARVGHRLQLQARQARPLGRVGHVEDAVWAFGDPLGLA